MKYRAEIDGLRAVAVLPVIFFHAGFDTFRGGFVGVDVFFVISGFLITSIIVSEKEAGSYSILKFYERRARRILPALYVVMAVCIPLAWVSLTPEDMLDFSQSLAAVSVFSSNILFWREAGYFDTAAELKPLLHTWSLGVEEQYYVLFPLLIMLCWWMGKRVLFFLLLGLALVSFVLAEWGAHNKPEATFFLLPTRAWELAVGALLALFLSRGRPISIDQTVGEFLGAVGLIMLAYAVWAYDNATPFPSLYALVPVVGTALLIVFATPSTVVGKTLGSRLLVGIGLLSYSAYLWHQPLFAFARHASIQEPAAITMLSLALVSVGLAYLTWRFVEAPFRSKPQCIRPMTVALFAIGGSALFIAVGVYGTFQNGFEDRYNQYAPYQDLMAKFSESDLRQECDRKDVQEVCILGNPAKSPTVAVFGDSHSRAMNQMFDQLAKASGSSFAHSGLGGCPPLLGVDVVPGNWNRNTCKNLAEKQFEYVRTNHIRIAILVARWSLYANGGYEKEERYKLVSDDHQQQSETSSLAALEDGLRQTIDRYRAIGTTVVVLLQPPQQVIEPKKFYLRALWSKRTNAEVASAIEQLAIPVEKHKALQTLYRSIIARYSEAPGVIVINPDKYFCDTNRCTFGEANSPFYRDDDHLSILGSFRLQPEFAKFFSASGGS